MATSAAHEDATFPELSSGGPVAHGTDPVEAALRAQFRRYRATRTRALRNEIVESQLGLAAQLARRYRRPGISDDDLRQVAFLGLVRAVDRFDIDRNIPFAAFASATIEGELKRHFRDHAWAVRVPRSAKELALDVRRATDQLGTSLHRSPTVAEIASHLGIDRDDVLRGLAAGAASSASSLDALVDVNSPALAETTDPDAVFIARDDADLVRRLLDHLPDRERTIVRLRFFDDLSQSEIATRVGMSQMHVSRLLRRALERLRAFAP
jgi:RNA polymerase sigma-B factor